MVQPARLRPRTSRWPIVNRWVLLVSISDVVRLLEMAGVAGPVSVVGPTLKLSANCAGERYTAP